MRDEAYRRAAALGDLLDDMPLTPEELLGREIESLQASLRADALLIRELRENVQSLRAYATQLLGEAGKLRRQLDAERANNKPAI